MRKGFLIATSAGFAAAAVPGAQAADMPIKAPRYVEPAASWAGWYIGANVGAAWQHAETNFFGYSFSKTAFIGGGQLGYNWQHGNFVFGLEGDISGLAGNNRLYEGLGSSIRWLSTVRGRFGLAVGDTMVYTTAGVAFGGVKNELGSYSSTRTSVGWTVGGGVEHMLTRNWTIGLEGLFVDLGRSHLDVKGSRFQFSNQAVIGRLKLNYKF